MLFVFIKAVYDKLTLYILFDIIIIKIQSGVKYDFVDSET